MNIDNKNVGNRFIELLEIIRKLRSPEGCSWDRKQTSESLAPYLLEEAYEVIEAIEDSNIETLKEAYAKEGFATKHYSPEMHLASFVLPPWIKQDIEGQKQNDRKEAA